MRDYELVMVLNPRLEEDEIEASLNKVSQWITQQGGNLAKLEKWGVRKLAYPIKHYNEGNYVFSQFQVDASQVRQLEANLKIAEEVLRYLVIKTEA
ncbi:MAG: 30S ribosomal protein S6 [Chloroflexota bacterium]